MLISTAALKRFSTLSPRRLWPGRPGRSSRRRSPPNTFANCSLKCLRRCTLDRSSPTSSFFASRSDPILDPLLAERLLLTLAALGVPADALPKMFQRAMGVIFEMILMVSARSKAADQKRLSAQMHKAIAALPPTEFPNLTQLREALVAETLEAGASKPNPEVAALYADRLIATLAPG